MAFKTITLTTIQTPEAVAILNANGVLYGDRSKGEFGASLRDGSGGTEDYCRRAYAAYDWLKAQMAWRIGPYPGPAAKVGDPLWAWVRWAGHAAPVDLRTMPWERGGGQSFWRLDLLVPREAVLLSCYQKWHIPLNDGHFLQTSAQISQKRRQATWAEVFRVGSRTSCVQATMWVLRKEWVTRATFHKVDPAKAATKAQALPE